MRRTALFLTAFALSGALAGCGGSGNGDAHTSSGPATSPGAPTPTATVSASPTSSPTAAPTGCVTSQLKAAVVDKGGAAGSTYFTVKLTNVGQQACTVEGYGGLSLVDGAGKQVGAPARRDGSAGKPQAVTLAPNASAGARVQLVEAANYDAAKCGFTTVVGLRVYPPDQTQSVVVPFYGDGCTHASVKLMSSQPYKAVG